VEESRQPSPATSRVGRALSLLEAARRVGRILSDTERTQGRAVDDHPVSTARFEPDGVLRCYGVEGGAPGAWIVEHRGVDLGTEPRPPLRAADREAKA
jgi:hypothetical protein